jgi:hypothetical protein
MLANGGAFCFQTISQKPKTHSDIRCGNSLIALGAGHANAGEILMSLRRSSRERCSTNRRARDIWSAGGLSHSRGRAHGQSPRSGRHPQRLRRNHNRVMHRAMLINPVKPQCFRIHRVLLRLRSYPRACFGEPRLSICCARVSIAHPRRASRRWL